MNVLKTIRSQEGITLIEVLIAMVILGFGMLSVVALQTSNVAYNMTSKRQSEGYTWIMDKIERLLIEDYSGSADLAIQGDPTSAGDGHTPDATDAAMISPYSMEWDVVASTDITNAKEVTVFIRWNGNDVANVTFMRTETSF